MNWPYSQNFLVQLKREDKERLEKAKARQERQRKANPAPTDPVIADLSIGFWVSLLSKRYAVPLGWSRPRSLKQLFPYGNNLKPGDISRMLEKIRVLRNRIAHHEPIFHLRLQEYWDDMLSLTGAMCQPSEALVKSNCAFPSVFKRGPDRLFMTTMITVTQNNTY